MKLTPPFRLFIAVNGGIVWIQRRYNHIFQLNAVNANIFPFNWR